MRAQRHLAAVCLASCAVLFLVGCGVDRRPVVIATGEVTAGSGPFDHSAPNGNAFDPKDPPATCGQSQGTQQSTSGALAVPTPFTDEDAELDVNGQAGDGRTVIVKDVRLTRTNGFVAVCSLDDDRLLGSFPISRSTAERSVRVTLDEPITTTTRLLVMLYADNGDARFDWATDPRVSGDEDDITDLEVERLTYRYGS